MHGPATPGAPSGVGRQGDAGDSATRARRPIESMKMGIPAKRLARRRARRLRNAVAAFLLLCALVAAGGGLGPAPVAAWTAGAPLTLDYPRLGMFWPDTWRQSPDDIARYDWVILGPWDASLHPELRRRNPDIILLTSTNACELGLDPDPGAEPWANEELARVPAQWLLTQVGAELTEPVGPAATILPVSRVTATDGGRTYGLFVAGDCAVIDGELVQVKRVDAAARTLTVRRGVVWPAAAHAAGARAAATISYWPHSVLLDESTFCPAVTVDPGSGPETWAEYNARLAAALVVDPAWDGLLVDRSDGGQSWLVGNSTARTIDPDRSNRVVSDGYAAFDAAWDAGLRHFEERLRAGVGDKLIYVNWGYPNYDLLNGNNFEGFPMTDATAYGLPWQAAVFGPRDAGSYLEWLTQARQPNLTMIETYEDDGGPDPTGDGSYDNPASHPGFRPDYRKMRFGLATALLGDGFFSYEINTNGHGSLGLLWFDEYDGGGRGRGYLGRPAGPAECAAGELTSANQVSAGGFETAAELAAWDWWTDDGYAGTPTRDATTAAVGASSARLEVTRAEGIGWRASLTAAPIAVEEGADYTLSFWARADAARLLEVWAQRQQDPWDTWLDFGSVRLTAEWRRFELGAPCAGDDDVAGLQFGVGQTTGVVWLDDVRLQKGSREVWRRDYDGGVALANATAGGQVVELDGTFRKLRGAQAPAVNDGSYVTQVTVPAHDGLILLRVTADEAAAARTLDAAVAAWAGCAVEAGKARAWHAVRERRATGSARARAARSREAWARARAAAALARDRIAATRAAFRAGDFPAARTRCAKATAASAAAEARVKAAWRTGHAAGSRASQAHGLALAAGPAVQAAGVALEALPRAGAGCAGHDRLSKGLSRQGCACGAFVDRPGGHETVPS